LISKVISKAFLRIFIFLVVIELLLRLGGFVFLALQERQNKILPGARAEYRVLCLGESTTALGGEDSYPNQLEKILNLGQTQTGFKVINKGIPSATTTHIALHVEEYLNEYQPDIVVAMLGINDHVSPLKEHNGLIAVAKGFFEHFNTYDLARSLWLRLFHQDINEKNERAEKQIQKIEVDVARAPSAENYTKLAGMYRAVNKSEQERETLLKALSLDPNDYQAWGYLGLHYKRLGDYQNAAPALEKMVALSPNTGDSKVAAYAELADCYRLWGKPRDSERVYLESIHFLPNHPGAYGCLANLYLEEKRYDEAEKLYEKQISINPNAVLFYGKLAHCYRRHGRHLAAERLLQQAIKFNPKVAVLYVELSLCLQENKKDREAQAVLNQAWELQTESSDDPNLDNDGYNPQTAANFQKIKNVLSQTKIPLVIVQYPMRDINPLKKIFYPAGDVHFVDNKTIFEHAVRKDGYDEYFTDRFAGDFGHCTAKGNRLLAGNIARVIEKIFK